MKSTNLLQVQTIVLLVVFVIISSCKKNDSSNRLNDNLDHTTYNQDNNRITLRWLAHWHGEGGKSKFIRDIAREFEFLNQDIKLEVVYPDDLFPGSQSWELYDKLCDSIAQMVNQNTWPFDVMLCDQARYWNVGTKINNQEWGKEYLMDYQHELWFQKAHKPGLLIEGNYASQFGGIIPGPLVEGNTDILYISSFVEEKLGLQIKTDNMTFSDFLMYSKRVNEYNNQHADKITFYSTQYYHAIKILFNQLVMSNYQKRAYSSKQEGLKAIFDTYVMLEKLALYKAAFQYYPSETNQRVLRHTEVLFEVFPSWVFALWEVNYPEGAKYIKPAELPSADGKISQIYSGGYTPIFVVPKHAQQVEAGTRFIKYLSTNEIATSWINLSKCPTGLYSKFSEADFGTDKFHVYYRNIAQKYGNRQGEPNTAEILLNSKTPITLHYIEIFEGKMSANEAYALLLKQTAHL